MLYIVATPIGNLEDITLRALNILKSVDVVLCEDTRVTGVLLNKFEISKKMISLHQHSSDEKIVSILKEFGNIAYVSDAGTPGISDPGNKIVQLAIENGHVICPIPGASAIVAALSVSGMPTDKFEFLGFMPKRGQQRIFDKIKDSEITIAFYESPHRIKKTLNKLVGILSVERTVVVCRELTKKFETIYRGTLEAVIPEIKEKGEFVVVVSGRK